MIDAVDANIPGLDSSIIPPDRIQSARNYGVWGETAWRDLYASDQLAWADNEIRMLNKVETDDPNSFDQKKTLQRDTLFQWRNGYLGEQTSAVGKKMDPKLEAEFQQYYTQAFEIAVKDFSPEEIESARRQLEGFQKRRNLTQVDPDAGSHSSDDDLYGGTGQFSRN